jgi:hypothetical protein
LTIGSYVVGPIESRDTVSRSFGSLCIWSARGPESVRLSGGILGHRGADEDETVSGYDLISGPGYST